MGLRSRSRKGGARSRSSPGAGGRADIGAGDRADIAAGDRADIGAGGRDDIGAGDRADIGAGGRDDIGAGLTILGLRADEPVRFRRDDGARWQEARVTRRERDGSVGLTDQRGAARAIPVERIEVRCAGPRGGEGWEPLSVRASRAEQLRLL